MSRRLRVVLTSVIAVAALGLTGCAGGGSSDTAGGDGTQAAGSGTTLSIYGYSVAKQVYSQLIPGYQATADGQGVQFQQSYGPSGDQSRKVEAGAPADIVSFSLEPDVTKLVDAGLVDASWNSNAHKGVPFGSVVAIVVRKGNPKGIKDWDDLLKPGISVVTPNPLSSGSAKWNLLAPYAEKSDGGKNQAAGLAYLTQLITQHVKVQPTSGREASEAFIQGTGDVLLSYENEASSLVKEGDKVQYFIPSQTFKIENPVAVVKKSKNAAAAQKFVDWLYTPAAQELVAKAGFRPVDESVAAKYSSEFPTPQKLWTIDDLGGWKSVNKDLFDKENGKVTTIYDKVSQ